MKSEFYTKLSRQFKQELPFVVFSLPTESKITAYLQKDDRLIEDFDLRKSGFAFGSFNSKHCYLIEKDEEFISDQLEVFDSEMKFSILDQGDSNKHMNLVQAAVDYIKNSALNKVVIARRIEASLQANSLAVFAKLTKKYPTAFNYCWYHPKVGLWLGASPELLVSTSDQHFKTVSLAGTRWKDQSSEWGSKELEEQQMVTQFIKEQLELLNVEFKCSELETIQAGKLLHLKQEFEGVLKGNTLKELIEKLHPTPAVCGLPSSLARSFIEANEDLDRSFYAGFMGPINQRSESGQPYSYLGVNIRSMQLVDQLAYLYVGGGITADSNPGLEWEETVRKSQTLSSIFE